MQPRSFAGSISIKRDRWNDNIKALPPCAREIFFWCLMHANFKGGVLQRGQLFTTYQEIADALSWSVGYRSERYSRSQIESAIKTLTKTAAIMTAKATRGLIITIVDYERWVRLPRRENHTETTP